MQPGYIFLDLFFIIFKIENFVHKRWFDFINYFINFNAQGSHFNKINKISKGGV